MSSNAQNTASNGQDNAGDAQDSASTLALVALSTQLIIFQGQLLHHVRQNEILGDEVKRYQWEKEMSGWVCFGYLVGAFLVGYFFGAHQNAT